MPDGTTGHYYLFNLIFFLPSVCSFWLCLCSIYVFVYASVHILFRNKYGNGYEGGCGPQMNIPIACCELIRFMLNWIYVTDTVLLSFYIVIVINMHLVMVDTWPLSYQSHVWMSASALQFFFFVVPLLITFCTHCFSCCSCILWAFCQIRQSLI